MLRVTHLEGEGSQRALRVEGRLTQPDLPRFEEACGALLASGQRLRLDLSGLQFADRASVAALRALRNRGVTLVGASGFVDALLADA